MQKILVCEVCDARMTPSDKKAREHVASHFLPWEFIIPNGVFSLSGCDRPGAQE